MKNHTVKVYSTPTCPYCVYAKDFFKENNVPFEDIDVSKDRKAGEEMVEKSGQMGVPVIQIDNNIIVGFQPEVFKSLLAK
ncbi:MAG: glutaredoxin domain-containing protein [Candidatus Paceibacterota bacterium]|jgi:glutaredoxin-like YruB-family protein